MSNQEPMYPEQPQQPAPQQPDFTAPSQSKQPTPPTGTQQPDFTAPGQPIPQRQPYLTQQAPQQPQPFLNQQPPGQPTPTLPVGYQPKPVGKLSPLSLIVDGGIIGIAVIAFLIPVIVEFIADSATGEGGDNPIQMLFVKFGTTGAIIIVALLATFGMKIINVFFTKYFITDDELRIELTFISHKSERFAFSKIQSVDVTQPLLARFLGVAALQIDVGSGGKDGKLAYIKRDEAYRLRDYLMLRAKGETIGISEGTAAPVGDALEDRSHTDEILYEVHPKALIATTFLHPAILWTAAVFLIVLGIVAKFGGAAAAGASFIVLIVMAIFSVGSALYQQVATLFNFKVTTNHTGGLRSSAGLTTLQSASTPIERIQGVSVEQPLLWRPFGWWMIKMEVLGRTTDKEKNATAKVMKTILMPVGTWSDVERILRFVWPQTNIDTIDMKPIPARARWLRWFDAQTYFWGMDEWVLVSRGHLLRRRWTLVPHARIQSVGLYQSWLQRLLRLADMKAHTTAGPVNLAVKHLDNGVARELTLNEMERMRNARLRMKSRPTSQR